MILTEKNQPIKEITHQDIYNLYDLWERLQSWQEILTVVDTYFSDKTTPVNKQQIARKYYACSKVFNLFYHDYHQSMSKIEELLEELRNRKKVLRTENAILLDSEGEERSI